MPASKDFLDMATKLIPVSLSSFKRLYYIGEAPRYKGSKDGWTTKNPLFILSINVPGTINPKEQMKARSKDGRISEIFFQLPLMSLVKG